MKIQIQDDHKEFDDTHLPPRSNLATKRAAADAEK